ncbi:acyltransferase-like protein At1g54570, chloroplastic isoform X4 [Mangifera indica]|uniref:acyltransferase-like protein At1g54570, chloroplastic isoform X4 n=1 Tax=Mangifera indica TaxID=29780 RepID=UPI001CFB60D2|nr:acyltransferase-like protein At1g54570, chloroplastic isoform X4 [Mangifera indica]
MTSIAACVAGLLPASRQIRRRGSLQTTSCLADNRRLEMKNVQGIRKSLKDFFDESKDFIKSDGGPPRWFSPLECGSRSYGSPLLLFLPGIDGVGLGLIQHHHMLGKIFDMWCLHIPVKDRTSFTGLVKLVEETVRSESHLSPGRPIYLVGESLGACIALAVASRSPSADLVLILANPATSFGRSQLQALLPFSEVISDLLHLSLLYILSSMKGDLLGMVTASMVKGIPLQQIVAELSQDVVAIPFYLSLQVLADILPQETLIWKLQMLKTASAYVNSCLHAIEAQTLILSSGRDQLLPSQEEGERLCHAIQKCETRHFSNNGHFLFLEDGPDLVSIIKGAHFYRSGKYLDYVSDYVPLTLSEFNKLYAYHRLLGNISSPVLLSTSEDGKIVKGLGGIPSEGPVLFVGYHMLLGLEVIPMICQLFIERKISLRGVGHPILFTKLRENSFHYTPPFDAIAMTGVVPLSAKNLYKLLSSKSHVLLYPGGIREALHRKGEEYKLFWPKQQEFIRMAAQFRAKIIPFGVVGEDDISELLFDYDDQIKIPCMRSHIEELTNAIEKFSCRWRGGQSIFTLSYMSSKISWSVLLLFWETN